MSSFENLSVQYRNVMDRWLEVDQRRYKFTEEQTYSVLELLKLNEGKEYDVRMMITE